MWVTLTKVTLLLLRHEFLIHFTTLINNKFTAFQDKICGFILVDCSMSREELSSAEMTLLPLLLWRKQPFSKDWMFLYLNKADHQKQLSRAESLASGQPTSSSTQLLNIHHQILPESCCKAWSLCLWMGNQSAQRSHHPEWMGFMNEWTTDGCAAHGPDYHLFVNCASESHHCAQHRSKAALFICHDSVKSIVFIWSL